MPLAVTVDELGEALSRRRADLGVSLRVVEQRTGISAATLSRIERGSTPDLVIIERLAAWLGVVVHASGGTPSTETQSITQSDADLRRTIELHLRANKQMSTELARAIANTFDTVMHVEIARAAEREAKAAGAGASDAPDATSPDR
jgi:transcriptional regulator with XRE-family HTH domain